MISFHFDKRLNALEERVVPKDSGIKALIEEGERHKPQHRQPKSLIEGGAVKSFITVAHEVLCRIEAGRSSTPASDARWLMHLIVTPAICRVPPRQDLQHLRAGRKPGGDDVAVDAEARAARADDADVRGGRAGQARPMRARRRGTPAQFETWRATAA
jgi:hypothetical protein